MMHILMLIGLFLLMLQPGQASYEYAAACVPGSWDYQTNMCKLILVGDTTTDIEIHTATITFTFNLPAGEVYQREFTEELHPILGVENKAIRVKASNEVQVLFYKGRYDSQYNQDVYMVPNHLQNLDTYFTSAYQSSIGCGSDTYSQFYLVSSFYNETSVYISQQDGTTYDLELPQFGTFIQFTSDPDNHLASGTLITGNKPINVVSGNLCVFNAVGSPNAADVYISNIPDITSLGKEYIVPRILTWDASNPAGYSVSVVATENNTVAVSDDKIEYLNQGETAQFEYENKDESTYVNCTKPCLVVQYTKNNDAYGLFMQNILSLHQFSTSAFFTTLDTHSTSYLSLVVQGEAPGDDLFLNGTSLGYLDWTAISGYSTTELPIPQGVYELVSIDGRPFAAYIYLHHESTRASSGYAFLPSHSSMTTSTTAPTTTPLPSLNATLPQHVVRVNGTAFTADGEAITPQCAVAHLNNLNQKVQGMVLRVNEEIGDSICLAAADILVVSSAAAMYPVHDKSPLEINHVLRVLGHHVVDAVETCALEIGSYLNNLAHWQQPIFPPVPDCSGLDIIPDYFTTEGTVWKCDNQLTEESIFEADNTLSYKNVVSEVLSTSDGGNLEDDCSRAYMTEASKKTSEMMTEISGALSMSGCSNVVTLATYSYSFVTLQDQAFYQASFFYAPNPAASFAEFLACMLQVHDFCLQHDNWTPGSQPGDPFLPIPPGCPSLEHDTNTLDDDGHRWLCV